MGGEYGITGWLKTFIKQSKYFNGYSNITDNEFLVFGVKGLLDTNKRLKDAMLFNILSFMSNHLRG